MMSDSEFNDAEFPDLPETVAHDPELPFYEPPEPVASEPGWAPVEPEPPPHEPLQPVAGEPDWELAKPETAVPAPTPAPAPVPYQPAPVPYRPAQVLYQPVPVQPPLAKPGQLQTLGILTLIDGILNVLWGTGLTIILLGTIVCWPLGIYALVLGILEIITATKLMADPVTADKPPTWLSIMQIVNVPSGNLLSIITGILGLVFYNDVQVKNYFDALAARRYRGGY